MYSSKCRIWTSSFIGLSALAGAPAGAAVIYSQMPASDITASASDRDHGEDGHRTADDFTLASSATLRSAKWRGSFASTDTPQFPLSFTITIFATSAGFPGTVVSEDVVAIDADDAIDTGIDSNGRDVYEFHVNLTPTSLAGGTTYWFSPIANTSNDADDSWYWTSANAHSFAAEQRDVTGSGAWIASTHGPLWFVLDDAAVPEPGSVALLGLAATHLLCRRRPAGFPLTISS